MRNANFGIDLGRSKCAIAVASGTDVRLVPNALGSFLTPSLIGVDPAGIVRVGAPARALQAADCRNAAAGFDALRSEELAVELLKSLMADVRRETGEAVKAAVIAVPPTFDASQLEATRKAAKLAGLAVSHLLPDPLAAAWAYRFQDQDKRDTAWMVYDFGGGSFRASIVRLRGEVIEVIAHSADARSGGGLMDKQIVEQLLIPALARGRGPAFLTAEVRVQLEFAAEEAKIRLSHDDSATIRIPALPFEYELERAELEQLVEPLIVRSLDICRALLRQTGLAAGDVEKVILAGGSTLMPRLRRRLAEGLSIPLEFSLDPRTVVARGAAVFKVAEIPESRKKPEERAAQAAQPRPLDENVQFTVYRPRTVRPGNWHPLLAFAHLAERPADALPDEPDPIAEVKRQAQQILGEEVTAFEDRTQDSTQPIPREGEITFVPEIPGVEFNPARRSFLWQEQVHREELAAGLGGTGRAGGQGPDVGLPGPHPGG
ncbi:MAG: Hsp70 family protein [Acidobacteriota bacterium]